MAEPILRVSNGYIFSLFTKEKSKGTEGQTWTEDSMDGLKPAQEQPGQKGTEITGSTQGPPDTLSFLSELKEFLQGDALMPQRVASVSVKLDSPLTLGSSETQLGQLAHINSSTPVLMSSNLMKVHHVELALPAVLLDLLQPPTQTGGGHGPNNTGDSQYRAFLLLKAVHTAMLLHKAEKGQRVKRAAGQHGQHGDTAGTSKLCQLHSLDMDLTPFVLSPASYDIKNCYGLCSFPLRNTNEHAVLLNSAISAGKDMGRSALCCVPVKYSSTDVLDVEQGNIVYKSRPLVATECGCR